MRSFASLAQSSTRCARILALVALLCTVALPVIEAGHLHGLTDSNPQCLLCKTPGLLPVVAAAVLLALYFGILLVPGAGLAPALGLRYLPRETRGPPACS